VGVMGVSLRRVFRDPDGHRRGTYSESFATDRSGGNLRQQLCRQGFPLDVSGLLGQHLCKIGFRLVV